MTRSDLNVILTAGEGKLQLSRRHPLRYLTRAAMAGAFIMVGSLISSISAAWFYTDYTPVAKLLGAVTFSAALILIVLLGGELFTGANFVMGVCPCRALYGCGCCATWAIFWVSSCWPSLSQAPPPAGTCSRPTWPSPFPPS